MCAGYMHVFAQQMPVSTSGPLPSPPQPCRDKMDKIKAKTTGTEEALKTTAEEAVRCVWRGEEGDGGGGGMEG